MFQKLFFLCLKFCNFLHFPTLEYCDWIFSVTTVSGTVQFLLILWYWVADTRFLTDTQMRYWVWATVPGEDTVLLILWYWMAVTASISSCYCQYQIAVPGDTGRKPCDTGLLYLLILGEWPADTGWPYLTFWLILKWDTGFQRLYLVRILLCWYWYQQLLVQSQTWSSNSLKTSYVPLCCWW